MSGYSQVTDGAIGGAAISVPLWLEQITSGLHVYVLVGGAILLTLRIVLTILDIKRRGS